MRIPFEASARNTVGIEWELMLVDPQTGDLVGRAPEIITALDTDGDARVRYTATTELLTNTIELTSGVGSDVAEAVADIRDAIDAAQRLTDPLGIALMGGGSHPFARWFDQTITDKTRYHTLVERTQWWGRNMMIWGVHVHVGVDDVRKVMPIIGALTDYLPHLQAISASSPFWAGERTGYASNRALVFQQLPTAGLPWPLRTWSEYESYLDDMMRADVMADATEVRWDIRPAPRWGTIEMRACDGATSLSELATLAALTQCLVEHFSRELDAGRELTPLLPWYHRENKWRTARYGLDAHVLVDRQGVERPVATHLVEMLETLTPIAVELGCRTELDGVHRILASGGSSRRQLQAADDAGGDLRAVAAHLISEFRGPAAAR
ncbi:glutamate--cysteine ligase [Salinibacterium sp. ZJ70]|uniref:glutamate--cysteine ligase n=1 Tax=Salinibacterium sp. ZJ70 TaxID=2708084 RepID=UPI00141DE6AF|nr:glutamate--cysteine ligase [Salinibacterium sp. ZJ70]